MERMFCSMEKAINLINLRRNHGAFEFQLGPARVGLDSLTRLLRVKQPVKKG